MTITVEISYYPLDKEFENPIIEFIRSIESNGKVKTEPGHMSTLIGGEYTDVMAVLTENIKPFMEKYPSVFALRMTNACKTFN
jgi:uncharacterized protein YqgV (UPF0045/DUF77 family)